MQQIHQVAEVGGGRPDLDVANRSLPAANANLRPLKAKKAQPVMTAPLHGERMR
jgi:hypothetical protein